MKNVFILFILSTLSQNIFAGETRTFKKVSEKEARVTINTGSTDGTQAATYVDGTENNEFIKMLLKDKTSELAKLKAKIELENCGTNSTEENSWIDACGEVTISEATKTSFARGGWMSASAGYTFFVGFRSDGSGHFFNTTHIVNFSETADASVDNNGEYIGVIEKTLYLDTIHLIPGVVVQEK